MGTVRMESSSAPSKLAKEAQAAEDLKMLAKCILKDGSFATRLASQPEASALMKAAGLDESKIFSEGIYKDPWVEFGDPEHRLSQASPITTRKLQLYFAHHFIPFVGFGFMDNAVMILMGDWIDSTLGVTFGISTMCAAGIGNTFSDVIGLWVSGFIETAVFAMGLPDHGLSNEQQQQLKIRVFKNTSMVLGIMSGCFLGMFPLIYPEEWRLWPSKEQKRELEPQSGPA